MIQIMWKIKLRLNKEEYLLELNKMFYDIFIKIKQYLDLIKKDMKAIQKSLIKIIKNNIVRKNKANQKQKQIRKSLFEKKLSKIKIHKFWKQST